MTAVVSAARVECLSHSQSLSSALVARPPPQDCEFPRGSDCDTPDHQSVPQQRCAARPDCLPVVLLDHVHVVCCRGRVAPSPSSPLALGGPLEGDTWKRVCFHLRG